MAAVLRERDPYTDSEDEGPSGCRPRGPSAVGGCLFAPWGGSGVALTTDGDAGATSDPSSPQRVSAEDDGAAAGGAAPTAPDGAADPASLRSAPSENSPGDDDGGSASDFRLLQRSSRPPLPDEPPPADPPPADPPAAAAAGAVGGVLKSCLKKSNGSKGPARRAAPSVPGGSEEEKKEDSTARRGGGTGGALPPRRTIFSGSRATASARTVRGGPAPRRVQWSTMAKVAHVPGLGSLGASDPGRIWWQRQDYDEFKKTSRMLAKALVEENSRVWLATTSVRNHSVQATMELASHWRAEHGDKWWCKFGHSRRGLEHITQIGVGRERQQKVVEAIRSVLKEQHVMLHSGKGIDPRRLCHVGMHFSLQARERAANNGMEDARLAFQVHGFSRPTPLVVPCRSELQQPSVPIPSCPIRKPSKHLDANTTRNVLRAAQKPVLPVLQKKPSFASKTAGFGQNGHTPTSAKQQQQAPTEPPPTEPLQPVARKISAESLNPQAAPESSPPGPLQPVALKISAESLVSQEGAAPFSSMKKKATGFGQFDSTADLQKLAAMS